MPFQSSFLVHVVVSTFLKFLRSTKFSEQPNLLQRCTCPSIENDLGCIFFNNLRHIVEVTTKRQIREIFSMMIFSLKRNFLGLLAVSAGGWRQVADLPPVQKGNLPYLPAASTASLRFLAYFGKLITVFSVKWVRTSVRAWFSNVIDYTFRNLRPLCIVHCDAMLTCSRTTQRKLLLWTHYWA